MPLNFKQLIATIKELSPDEKLKIQEMIKKEMKQKAVVEVVRTHFASEKTLSRDWLLPEEEEAWKDL